MLVYNVPGVFSSDVCERLKKKLQGKTFFNFDIQHGGVAGNHSVAVVSNLDDGCHAKNDLADLLIHYLVAHFQEA